MCLSQWRSKHIRGRYILINFRFVFRMHNIEKGKNKTPNIYNNHNGQPEDNTHIRIVFY